MDGMRCVLRFVAPLGLAAAAQGQETTRASVRTLGGQANRDSAQVAVSANERFVAFVSDASDLVRGDTNGVSDVFVHDRRTGFTFRVSLASTGEEGNGASYSPTISADGRYVAFTSDADNLAHGDNNGRSDVFVHDMKTDVTELVSVSDSGATGDGWCTASAISADGRFVAFSSQSTNLVPGDTNGLFDVYVRDRVLGTTRRASLSTAGVEPDQNCEHPSISDDGERVVFESRADNLVSGDTNNQIDVFLHDFASGTTTRVDVDASGAQSPSGGYYSRISGDGRWVVFSTYSALLSQDTNGSQDVYLRDLDHNVLLLASLGVGSASANGWCGESTVSADGARVAFSSSATNLVAGDTNGAMDVFVWDRLAGTTTRADVDTGGSQASRGAKAPVISGDGSVVGFVSASTDLVLGDTNGKDDVFARAPWLTLEASSTDVSAGQPILMTTWTGRPGGPAALLLTTVDGVPASQLLAVGSFDAAGIFAVAPHLYGGPGGRAVGLTSVGQARNGKLERTTEVFVTLR